MFGALGGVLPLRLGGSATNGVTAAQHARLVADLIATFRVAPFAAWTYTKSGATVTISNYRGFNGTGAAYAPAATVNGTGDVTFSWSSQAYEDELGDDTRNFGLVAADACPMVNSPESAAIVVVTTNSVRVVTIGFGGGAGANDVPTSVEAWGRNARDAAAIGDYGGDPEKEDSATEGELPYAAAILLDLQKRRGSAYTKTTGTLVDAENLALARMLAATGPRQAEKLRANATPRRADEKLDWWRRVLAVPVKPGEPRWRVRQKVAAHYRLTDGPTLGTVRGALEGLLGDAFVDMSWDEGSTLSVPPTPTYWPGVNPGSPADSLGGGTWLSTRCHLFVQVQIPSNMTFGSFLTLVNVDLKALLDRMLPAWATFDWAIGDTGFLVSGSETDSAGGLVDFTGL
jgi:hypothetical protein